VLAADGSHAAPPVVAPVSEVNPEMTALLMRDFIRPWDARDSERSKFSRAGPSKVTRSVRVLDKVAQTDATGAKFFRFAVDTTYAVDVIKGCIYEQGAGIFVHRGDRTVSAMTLIGKKEKAATATTCVAAPPTPAS